MLIKHPISAMIGNQLDLDVEWHVLFWICFKWVVLRVLIEPYKTVQESQ